MRTKHDIACSLAICLYLVLMAQSCLAEEPRPFSVREDIELTQFGDVYHAPREDVVVSPAGDRVVVHTTRASLEDGKLHDELRVYDVGQIRAFVNASGEAPLPKPLWIIEESTAKEGGSKPLITRIRWLRDGSGIAFLLYSAQHRRLYLARFGGRKVVPLSSDQDDVLSFDVRNQSHYVFTIASRTLKNTLKSELDAPFRVGTGRRFYELLFPDAVYQFIGRGDLWAATGGPPAPVMNRLTGQPVFVYEDGGIALSLSPRGESVVTVSPLVEVPKEWETRFPPPFPNDAYRLRAGPQDLNAAHGIGFAGEYVRIDLTTGNVTHLTNAPAALRVGWWEADETPAWSDDGSRVLLPGTFDAKYNAVDERPCISVVQIASGSAECVRPLKRNLEDGFEDGYETIDQSVFAEGRNDQVLLRNTNDGDWGRRIRLYTRSNIGIWQLEATESRALSNGALEVKVKATFKDPPILTASDAVTGKTRTIFDPNPQMKDMVLGQPELYEWTDGSGHQWHGILFKPVGYRANVRYPLVIQNHGYSVDRFTPSGGFPSAFVAQELASAGIMVLHVQDCDGRSTQLEGPCNVKEYEAAVAKLSNDGIIDSSRVGIIGFSRTVFYVLEALTTSNLRFKAASISDGITVGYMDYLNSVAPNDTYQKEAEALMGASPFGLGLVQWLKASPDFNMDKVASPLRVVSSKSGVAEMWEPYALLEAMHKPVDLIVLNTYEHIITDPAVRLAVQGGNVDWFRFWLQDYEDPDPHKVDQYARWRRLRALRKE